MTLLYRFRPALLAFVLAGSMAFSTCLLFQATPLWAATGYDRANTPAANQAGHVTIIILDMSGSMAQNDPEGYRCSAANAYIDLSGTSGSDQKNLVGIIGLDNNSGATGGPHNYRTAQVWSAPVDMSTKAARNGLRATIAQQSHNCKPDSSTPTYDALNKALQLLGTATQNGAYSGSVVLLTDGVPDPDPSGQIASIQADLAPQFKAHNWPVDTIALGADSGGFHDFLSTLANATLGKFYDDSHGPVAGVSPLNLEHFFVDIFQTRNGRTPGPTIKPASLSGAVQQPFTVDPFVAHLDVIAVKDQSGTQVTITAPDGQAIPPETADAFVSTDPHYVIFSITNPQPGEWVLHANGSGMFLMDSLVVSQQTLAITAPSAGKTLPLGQAITLTAHLQNGNSIFVGDNAALTATITFVGNGQFTPRTVEMKDANNSGNYTGALTIGTDQPKGSYQIDVSAREGSVTTVQSHVIVQFALFPTPVLLSPAGTPTHDLVGAHVVTWDPVLQFIYSLPIIGGNVFGWHPSDWPLNGLAASPQALVKGEVLVGDSPYGNATVKATATQAGSTAPITVDVQNDANGNFRLFFPKGAKGSYTVNLTAQGTFKDSFGALGSSDGRVQVTIGLPSLLDELRAWAITLLYLLIAGTVFLFGIYGPINYGVRAKPSKRARLIDVAANLRARSRTQLDAGLPLIWRGWSLRRYFAPNVLPASEVSLPANLAFVFRRGNEVAVRVRKSRGKDAGPQWSVDGRTLTAADGTETILSNMRLAYTEAGQKTEWKFEQDVRDVNDYTGGSGATGIRERIEDAAGNVGLRDRLRRGRGLRND